MDSRSSCQRCPLLKQQNLLLNERYSELQCITSVIGQRYYELHLLTHHFYRRAYNKLVQSLIPLLMTFAQGPPVSTNSTPSIREAPSISTLLETEFEDI